MAILTRAEISRMLNEYVQMHQGTMRFDTITGGAVCQAIEDARADAQAAAIQAMDTAALPLVLTAQERRGFMSSWAKMDATRA